MCVSTLSNASSKTEAHISDLETTSAIYALCRAGSWDPSPLSSSVFRFTKAAVHFLGQLDNVGLDVTYVKALTSRARLNWKVTVMQRQRIP